MLIIADGARGIVFLLIRSPKEQAGLSVIRFVEQGIFEARDGAIGVVAFHIELANLNVVHREYWIVSGRLRLRGRWSGGCLRKAGRSTSQSKEENRKS